MTISYGLNVYAEGSIKMRTGYATTCTRWRKIIPIIFNKSYIPQTLFGGNQSNIELWDFLRKHLNGHISTWQPSLGSLMPGLEHQLSVSMGFYGVSFYGP